MTQVNLAAALGEVDQTQIDQLQAQRTQAEQELAANQGEVDALEAQVAEIDAELFVTNQEYQFAKAEYDADRYEFEELQDTDPEEAADRRPEIGAMFQHWLDLGLEVEALTAQRDEGRARIREFTDRIGEIDAQLNELTAETSRLSTQLDDLAPSVVNDYLLNAPLLDFMAPSITVQQVITATIVDDVNFTQVAKMDRCGTCHLAIDRQGYEDYPQPFRTHPNLEAYVGQCLASSRGQVWLHRVPRGDGTVDLVQDLVAHAC